MAQLQRVVNVGRLRQEVCSVLDLGVERLDRQLHGVSDLGVEVGG